MRVREVTLQHASCAMHGRVTRLAGGGGHHHDCALAGELLHRIRVHGQHARPVQQQGRLPRDALGHILRVTRLGAVDHGQVVFHGRTDGGRQPDRSALL